VPAPFSHGLGIEVVASSQVRYAFLTTLYRSTQCRSRAGAAMQKLSHSDSLADSDRQTTPSLYRTKHLERV
jgi:hypothetical protein